MQDVALLSSEIAEEFSLDAADGGVQLGDGTRARFSDLDDVAAAIGRFLPLGLVKIAGALGLLAGIAYRPLGIAAAIGVVLYFLGAVITHLRAGDKKGVGTPAVIMLVAAAPLVLGLATV